MPAQLGVAPAFRCEDHGAHRLLRLRPHVACARRLDLPMVLVGNLFRLLVSEPGSDRTAFNIERGMASLVMVRMTRALPLRAMTAAVRAVASSEKQGKPFSSILPVIRRSATRRRVWTCFVVTGRTSRAVSMVEMPRRDLVGEGGACLGVDGQPAGGTPGAELIRVDDGAHDRHARGFDVAFLRLGQLAPGLVGLRQDGGRPP